MEIVVKVLLGITSVAGLAVIVWRLWTLRWNKVMPPQILGALASCRSVDGAPALCQVCDEHPSPLGRLLVVASSNLDEPKAENIASLETAARHEVVRMER